MKNGQPRPKRHKDLRNNIASMSIRDWYIVEPWEAQDGSVKAIVSRLRKQFKGRRRYKTTRLDYGTRVERLP